MNTKILGTVAVAGAVATFALLNVNGPVAGSNFLSATSISDAERAFINFIGEYRRTYGTKEEYSYRLAVFEETYNRVMTHNSQNGVSYTLGINGLADLSAYEYKQMLGYTPSKKTGHKQTMFNISNSDSVDWRDEGAVTGVKNQGSCGSCWAFSTTGSLEGMNKIATGTLTSFSEQQLVDCAGLRYGNLGCNGGSMDGAMSYVHDSPLDTEDDYPYTGKDGTCTASGSGLQISSHTDVTSKSPDALKTAVTQQPVSVAIEADKLVFQSYTSGIITSTSCGTNLDHGVLVVGYGTDAGQDFWLLKNSWGPTWGEDGFFRIARDMTTDGQGICGLQTQPVYPNA